jgi:hypothetical protein
VIVGVDVIVGVLVIVGVEVGVGVPPPTQSLQILGHSRSLPPTSPPMTFIVRQTSWSPYIVPSAPVPSMSPSHRRVCPALN